MEFFGSLSLLIVAVFFLLKMLPGGPFDDDIAMNPVVRESLNKTWNLEQNSFNQALQYYSKALTGDFGVSMLRPERSVSSLILQGLKNTLLLNLMGLVGTVVGALGLAFLWALYRQSKAGLAIEQITIALLSLPSLFFGPLLIYIFGFYFDFLPVAFLSSPVHYILPLITLCARPVATLTRILMSSIDQNLVQDYVRTAKAKGIASTRVLFVHVLKNSMIPFLSYLGPLTVAIFSGSFLVEVLFAVPGLGMEFVNALNERDYTLIAGMTLFYGFLLILVNSFLDILIISVDPRLKERTS